MRTFHADYGAALGVAAGPDGSIAAGGYARGAADLGDGPFDTGAATEAVVVRYDADGARRAGRGASRETPLRCGRSRSTRAACGSTAPSENFATVAGRTFRSARAPDSFVARLDPGGTVTDAWQLAGDGDEQAVALATPGDGDAVTVGYYSGAGQLGATALRPPGSPAGFAARLSAGGAVAWTRTFGTAGATLRGVARTPGGYAVVGLFSGAVDIGAGLASAGRIDTWSVADDGALRWAMSRDPAAPATTSPAASRATRAATCTS